jgi:alpha-tubulin suppressor-like RCC1 family protein
MANTSYEIVTGLKTTDPNTGNKQDLGSRYVSKSYLIDVYPNLASERYSSGIFSWGPNGEGQLGSGISTGSVRSSPVQIGNLNEWKSVYAGDSSFAIRRNGTLWAWGINSSGILGIGLTASRSSPVQVGTDTNWKDIAMATSSANPATIAVKTNGTLWSWGNGNSGQLGNGTVTNRSSPVQVGTLTDWKYIAAGNRIAGSIKIDGTLWMWGLGTGGALGNGTVTTVSSPVQVGTLTNWKQIALSDMGHALAVRTDGTLWAWGVNTTGALGNGSTINRSSPIQVGTLTDWKYVSVGGRNESSSYAIKIDGTLWAWGQNLHGQLGDGTKNNKSSPVQIGTLNNWKQVSGGIAIRDDINSGYALAVKTDGTLWAWGANLNGILGDSSSIDKVSPVQVGTLTNWKQASASQRTSNLNGDVSMGILDGQI